MKLKNIFFCSFQLFENGHIHNVVLTLINVVKLDVENNNIVLTQSNVVNSNVEIDNVDSTLFNIVTFNVDIHNVVSRLIWHCLSSWRHITLTTILRQRWNMCWILKNVAKRLHNFCKVYQIENKYLVEYLLIAAFLSFLKAIDRIILVQKKQKKPLLNNDNVRAMWAKRTQ